MGVLKLHGWLFDLLSLRVKLSLGRTLNPNLVYEWLLLFIGWRSLSCCVSASLTVFPALFLCVCEVGGAGVMLIHKDVSFTPLPNYLSSPANTRMLLPANECELCRAFFFSGELDVH